MMMMMMMTIMQRVYVSQICDTHTFAYTFDKMIDDYVDAKSISGTDMWHLYLWWDGNDDDDDDDDDDAKSISGTDLWHLYFL